MASTLIIYLLSQYVQALPITTIDKRDEVCHDISNSRTMWDIIRSCLTVVFLCTWVAFHWDVTPPGKDKAWTFVRYTNRLIGVIIAPEGAIIYACFDLIAARKLAKQFKGYGWTLTHGFFAKMGGFVLYDGDVFSRALIEGDELEPYLKSGGIRVTAEEIQDKSKSDALAKAIVLLQTTWFILQLIARSMQNLPITELEVATLSYAALNFLTYGFWWHKPVNVGSPIRVYKEKQAPQVDINNISSSHNPMETPVPEYPGEDEAHLSPTVIKGAVNLDHTESLADNSRSLEVDIKQDGIGNENNMDLPKENTMNLSPTDGEKDGQLTRFVDGALAVLTKNEDTTLIIAGIILGAIHCIAWSYHFPTLAEKIIWRACSVFITAIPVPVFSLDWLFPSPKDDNVLSNTIFYVVFTTYMLARLTLIALAFATLRSLPPGALAAVQWTTFIPHI